LALYYFAYLNLLFIDAWLEKWAKNGKWEFEQRASDKNAKYYSLSQTEKLAKLPNIDKKEI
jgi:hypothetical protein